MRLARGLVTGRKHYPMTAHTPGPWKIDGGTGKDGDLYVWKAGNYFGGHAIATVHGEIEEGANANARLIAAAPDLLSSLQEMTAYARELLNVLVMWEHIDPDKYPALKQYAMTGRYTNDSACDRADAAVAKATHD